MKVKELIAMLHSIEDEESDITMVCGACSACSTCEDTEVTLVKRPVYDTEHLYLEQNKKPNGA